MEDLDSLLLKAQENDALWNFLYAYTYFQPNTLPSQTIQTLKSRRIFALYDWCYIAPLRDIITIHSPTDTVGCWLQTTVPSIFPILCLPDTYEKASVHGFPNRVGLSCRRALSSSSSFHLFLDEERLHGLRSCNVAKVLIPCIFPIPCTPDTFGKASAHGFPNGISLSCGRALSSSSSFHLFLDEEGLHGLCSCNVTKVLVPFIFPIPCTPNTFGKASAHGFPNGVGPSCGRVLSSSSSFHFFLDEEGLH